MFTLMINSVSTNIVSKCKELLIVSKIHHEFKVHWEIWKGKDGCSLKVQSSLER